MADPRMSPAEAAFLVEPSVSSAGRCLQAALLTLLGQGHVEFGEKGSLLSDRMLHLRLGDGRPLPQHIAAVRNALRDYRSGTSSLTRTHVIHALQKRFGLGYGRYVHDHVAPALIERGHLRLERKRFLGLIPYRHYERTTQGYGAAAPLRRLIDEIDDLPSWIAADPDRALAMARSAGILLILSPKARRQIPKLRKLVQSRDGDGSSVTYVYTSDEDDGHWNQVIDLGDMQLGDDAFDLFDSVDAAGDFTSGDGGSDGGGDGGGGD